LTQAVELAEVDALIRKYGPAPHRHHRLEVDSPFLTGTNQQLVRDGRRAEICYVMHRGDPGDGLLLHIKHFYPAGAYRLPTGGVQQGETVEATLVREIREETGLAIALNGEPTGGPHVQVDRFLGLVSYDLAHRSAGRIFPFATYFFLVAAPPAVVLAPQDAEEQIAGWRWTPAGELSRVAATLEDVRQEVPEWGDWGRFRALGHRFVMEQLPG